MSQTKQTQPQWKQRQSEYSSFNQQQTAEMRERILGKVETVTSEAGFVWTQLAEQKNPGRSVAGEKVWPQYLREAPRKWLDEGIIIDSTEYDGRDGQVDLFDILKG